MPTTQTWLGGGNNNAGNRHAWSPSGTPRPGETLTIKGGTINVYQNQLDGDTLNVAWTLNYPNPQPTVTINTYNDSVLTLDSGGDNNGGVPIPVNVNVHGSLFLDMPSASGEALITKGGSITFIGGSSNFWGASQVFHDPLYGTGNITISSGTHVSEHMELGGYVGAGLNFIVDGNGPPLTSLQIDHPNEFHGFLEVNCLFGNPGEDSGLNYVAFMGLHVTSIDVSSDLIQMFNGGKLVDSTSYSGGTNNLEFEQTNAGVMLTSTIWPNGVGGAGTVIPLHVS